MKKLFITLVLTVLSGMIMSQAMAEDKFRQAVYGALDQAKSAMRTAPFGNKTVAILPFKGDTDSLFVGRLKNIVTDCGFVCVEGKEDPMWSEIIKEIAWDENKDDILDAATIVKFGKLKAAQILLYGKIASLDHNQERVYVEIELHATDISTKQHIWGGNFAYRFYNAKGLQGIISLDNGIKNLLKNNFKEVQKSLESPVFASKLNNIKTVTVIPLAGDIDQYVTSLAIEMLTQTKHSPKSPQIPTLTQVRFAAREGSLGSDAVFYGAIRDLRRTGDTFSITNDKRIETKYKVHADIQLFLEDTKTGVIPWSKTVTLEGDIVNYRNMTSQELADYRQGKFDTVLDEVKEDAVDNWKIYLKWICLGIGGIIALIVVIAIIRGILGNFNMR